VLSVAQRYGTGTLVWSPLAKGMLTGRVRKGQPTDLRRAAIFTSFSDERRLDAVERIIPIGEQAGLPMTHLAMAFAIAHPGVTSALIGPLTMEQLDDLLAGADVRLTDDLLDRIDEIVPPGTDVGTPDQSAYLPPKFAAFDPRVKVFAGIAGAYNTPYAMRSGIGPDHYRQVLASFTAVAEDHDRGGEVLYVPAVAAGGEAAMPGEEPFACYGTGRGASAYWENSVTRASVRELLTVDHSCRPAHPAGTRRHWRWCAPSGGSAPGCRAAVSGSFRCAAGERQGFPGQRRPVLAGCRV
jgi:Aldo/keto reductase family